MKLAFWRWEEKKKKVEGVGRREGGLVSPLGRKWNEVLVQEEAEEEIMHILHLLRSTQVEH